MRPAVSKTATRASTVSSTVETKLRSTMSADSMRWRERAMLSIWRRAWLSSMVVMAWRPRTVRVCIWKGVSLRAGRVEDKERADADSGGRDERSAGIEAEGAAGEGDPAGSEGGMVAGVGDFVDVLGAERRHSGQRAERAVRSRGCRSGRGCRCDRRRRRETPATGVLQTLAASSTRSSMAGSGAASRI